MSQCLSHAVAWQELTCEAPKRLWNPVVPHKLSGLQCELHSWRCAREGLEVAFPEFSCFSSWNTPEPNGDPAQKPLLVASPGQRTRKAAESHFCLITLKVNTKSLRAAVCASPPHQAAPAGEANSAAWQSESSAPSLRSRPQSSTSPGRPLPSWRCPQPSRRRCVSCGCWQSDCPKQKP